MENTIDLYFPKYSSIFIKCLQKRTQIWMRNNYRKLEKSHMGIPSGDLQQTKIAKRHGFAFLFVCIWQVI